MTATGNDLAPAHSFCCSQLHFNARGP